MAKNTHDREDLLRDATNYVRRIEFDSSDQDESIFCGFRECGALSVYFGQDYVLQFNADNELRRAFWRDRMLASYQGKLHWLDRSEGRVRLSRTPLSEAESVDFISSAANRMQTLQENLATNKLNVHGQIPQDGNINQQVVDWLNENCSEMRFALHPGLARTEKKPLDS